MKSIEVTIAGRSYPLKVSEEEQVLVTNVANEINQKVRDFQKTYRNKDRQDCLSMALLTYALEYTKVRDQKSVVDQVKARTDSIQAVLDGLK